MKICLNIEERDLTEIIYNYNLSILHFYLYSIAIILIIFVLCNLHASYSSSPFPFFHTLKKQKLRSCYEECCTFASLSQESLGAHEGKARNLNGEGGRKVELHPSRGGGSLEKINIHGISPGKGSRAQRGAAITHSVPIVRPQMKCQRHDELTILSNSCSGADEREHEHCADSFSRAYLVLAAVAVFLSLSRYVFMHINYLEPKPLISRQLRTTSYCSFSSTLSLPSPLLFACRGKRTSTLPLSLFRDYCISINQIICIEGGGK